MTPADVENAYAGLEKKGKGKKGKGSSKVADSSQAEDKKLMHSLDMLGAFATLKVGLLVFEFCHACSQLCTYMCSCLQLGGAGTS